MSFTHADTAITQLTAAATTASVTLSAAIGAGDLIIGYAGTPNILSQNPGDITDTAGNAWHVGPTNHNGTMFYCLSAVAAAGGTTITIAHGGSSGTRFIVADRFTWTGAPPPQFGAVASQAVSGTSGNSGAVGPVPSGALIYAALHGDTGSLTFTAGSSNGTSATIGSQVGNTGGSGFSQYILAGAGGTENISWTASASVATNGSSGEIVFSVVPVFLQVLDPLPSAPLSQVFGPAVAFAVPPPIITFPPPATAGPPVYPLQGPVASQGRRQPPPRGREAANRGTYAQLGPPVYPLRGPVAPAARGLPSRGRGQGNRGIRHQTGPPVYPLQGPIASRGRGFPSRGRTAGRAGTYAQLGPPVYPAHGPVTARRPSQLAGGRCRWNAGTFTAVSGPQAGPPVYPLQGPVTSRGRGLPSRGRCQGNRGVRHQSGPPVTPRRGPAAAFRPGPFRSGRCAWNRGAYAQAGPPFWPLRWPHRAPVPARPRGGRTAGNAGAPVFVPAFTIGTLTAADIPGSLLTAGTAANALTGSTVAPAVLTGRDQRTGGPS
jgi:hypothetical protein